MKKTFSITLISYCTTIAKGLKHIFFIATILLLLLELITPAKAQQQGQGRGSSTAALLKNLLDSVQGYAPVSSSRVTMSLDGFVRYLGASPGNYFPTKGTLDPDARARAFLDQWGGLFHRATSKSSYTTVRIKSEDERFYVRLQQLYAELPVYGAQMIVQLDAAMNVTNVHSDIMRDFSPFEVGEVGLNPTISAEKARYLAIEQIVSPGNQGTATEAELMVYSPAIVGASGVVQLVWQTIVQGTTGDPLKEMVLINAHNGSVALRYPLIHNAKYREIYDAANTYADPGTLARAEDDPVSPISDVNQAYDYLGDTYNFYYPEHGRDSFDNAGTTLSATVRFCYPLYPCPFPNAFWDTVIGRMYLGEGFAAADDVVAHELTHGVTTHESNLIYAYQSGAINESLSDVWGEFVDLTNSGGTDTISVRWQLGEDIPSYGAIRDMADPTVFGDPDRILNPLYYCGLDDNGGVHTNSGVNNKLCYLLTDGDLFNGRTVTGMGISKVADLYYECQVNLLTEASDYLDLYNALTQAAINLEFSQAERDSIEEACLAVELNEIPCSSNFGCEGYCGGPSPDGCWCDEACHSFGDCCPDKCDFCPGPLCPTDCQITISPSSVNIYTYETVQFSATVDGVCNDPCYTWDIVVQESTGSYIDSTGLYTAGGNAGTDIVQVTDPCNGSVSDTATVTVLRNPVPLDCTKLLGSSQNRELFSIDITTGSATLIGYMPVGLATEIEYDILGGTLYAEETDGGVNLHTIDPTTGQSLGFVTHEFGALNGLEFVGSTLYAAFIPMGGSPSTLVIVDSVTGSLTSVGPTGFGPISGLAYDEGSEVMYGVTAGGAPANIVTIDLSTGAATLIGSTGLDRIGSIEFGPDGNLYGGVSQKGSAFANYLVQIDPSTGTSTPIGDTGFSITGLTSCSEGEGCILPCSEDESGTLNIIETSGTSGNQVTVTVEINSAPNAIDAMGFEVVYNPSCLEYIGYTRGSCVVNWSFVDVTNPAPGVLRFGGFTTVDPVLAGESCDVVKLTFLITTPELDDPGEAVRLDLQALVDDISGWSTSPGYICGGCSCDVNGDGIITPQDALCAFQKYLGICPTACGPCDMICGDINGDGNTTPADALCIFQEYLGIGCAYCEVPSQCPCSGYVEQASYPGVARIDHQALFA